MTTVDQEEGILKGPEPLKTLKTYRMYSGSNKVLQSYGRQNGIFGVCCAVLEEGTISVGDGVYVPFSIF